MFRELIKKLGVYATRKAGEEYIFTCPKTDCRSKKFEVNFKKKKFHCFRCKYGGSLPQLLADVGVPKEAVQVLTIKRELLRDDLYRATGFSRAIEQKIGIEIPGFLPMTLTTKMEEYLHRRGIHEWPKSWGTSSDRRLSGRIVIPIHEEGLIQCYAARAIDDTEPKELFPAATTGVNKSHYVWGLDDIKQGDHVTLTEGIFDALSVRATGNKACAVLGSNLSDVQTGKLLSKKPASITLCFDGDDAGRKEWIAAYRKLCGRRFQQIYIVNLPDGQDPNSLHLVGKLASELNGEIEK